MMTGKMVTGRGKVGWKEVSVGLDIVGCWAMRRARIGKWYVLRGFSLSFWNFRHVEEVASCMVA